MSRRAAVSAIELVHGRGFINRRSHKSGILSPPFSLFSTKAFQPKRRTIDFSSVKELDDAIKLFGEMKSMRPEPSILVYNKFMSVCVKIEQYSFALNVFDEMLQKGFPVNRYTMNIAVNCCCHLKDINSGFAIVALFFKSGYEPDAATINPLIRRLFLEGKEAEAVKLFQKVLDLKVCEPNGVMILHLIDGLCKTGKVVEAYDWVRRLESCGWRPNINAYNTLINGFCKGGQIDEALELLLKMTNKGMLPDVVTYNTMIKGLFDNGRHTDVGDLLNEMANSKISLNVRTFSILIDAYCKEGKMDEAANVLETMTQQNIFPNVFTYSTLIEGFCLKGEIDTAKQLLDSMVEMGLKPNIVSYSSLLNGYCKKGSVDEAWLLFLDIPGKGLVHNTHTYTTMIHGLFSKDRIVEGLKLFEDMKAQQVRPNMHTFTTLLDGMCRKGEIDEALSLLRMIEDEGFTPDIVMVFGGGKTLACRDGEPWLWT
ncbi:pentatricopeptide repeat-containing protein At1g62670, mitochondrial-like isoform X2 [Salvia hispanica]|uniref:pentatricopeptide repeat-containing protein At1g62670, mitochondrial-like isoform X2 n=1 Tax=Salvia hispanica TaxID=49212 RepID=UPI002008F3CD|nr:pentatricopeptide repeat-containing protein At1g62670, mitochondrial-like isoform X2 [Salvia hispanica]